jgi:hypothetical protein
MMKYNSRYKCSVCPRLGGTIPCKNCECSHYCSDECRVVDLPVHRMLCKSYARFKIFLGQSKRRAIYLPVDGPGPEFVWIEMEKESEYCLPRFEALQQDYLGGSKNHLLLQIPQDMVSMVKIFPYIMLVYGSAPPYTDQPLNKSISTLLGKETHGVRGPVIAFGHTTHQRADGQRSDFVTDLDTRDLAVISN